MSSALPKERAISFSEPMVIALPRIVRAKTMTRRVAKLPRWAEPVSATEQFEIIDGRPHAISRKTGCLAEVHCPYGQPGDRLWVREHYFKVQSGIAMYRADGKGNQLKPPRWTPPMLMPRWASRFTLEIIATRFERLHDITDEDCLREGIVEFTKDGNLVKYDYFKDHELGSRHWKDMARTPIGAFSLLWDDIGGTGAWARNDYVWVLTFKRLARS